MPSPSDFEPEVVRRVVRQVLAQGEDTADRDRLCPRRALEMCLPHLERLAGLPTAAAVDLRTANAMVVRDELVQLGLARPEGATMAELSQRMDCCQKTVRRHLSWMRRRFSMRIARVGWEQGANRRWVYPVGQSSIFTKEARRMLA